MTDVKMVVVNLTNHTLTFDDLKGDDVRPGPDPIVGPGQAGVVAIFDAASKRWDWVYLNDKHSGLKYQLYIEETSNKTRYTFFGYKNDASSESNGNPSPFPGGTEMCYWGGQSAALYTLLSPPPPRS